MKICGLCGSAYHWPWYMREGTMKSRAPSGVVLMRNGVSTSMKSWPGEVLACGEGDVVSRLQDGLHAGPAQIDVPMLEALLFGDLVGIGVGKDRRLLRCG